MTVHIITADDSDLGTGGMWIVAVYTDQAFAYADLVQLEEALSILTVRGHYRVGDDEQRAQVTKALREIDPHGGGNLATVSYSVAEHDVFDAHNGRAA